MQSSQRRVVGLGPPLTTPPPSAPSALLLLDRAARDRAFAVWTAGLDWTSLPAAYCAGGERPPWEQP